ncbi:integral membrane [Trichoderma arundinaceum]|uniref:Integral membrane n=1 Tax=Trichoderma arundinaceum TaxID=490622 RepID=A0A395NMJ5_TRIAR|nr:integral membrane [Trichoderma arundinaceum]
MPSIWNQIKLLTSFVSSHPAFATSTLADDADNPTGQSTFISPDGSLAFAFTVPDNGNTDIYFSLRVSTSRSWGAIGLGSDDMPGALFLILYRSKNNQNNVTFSPRLAYGNYEPKYYPDLKFEVFSGTGVKDGYMTFNAVCKEHCRSWPAGGTSRGYIDVSSPNQKAIYALGPKESFSDDQLSANLKMHSEHGTFTIDMKRTQGRADLPVLTKDSVAEGTTLDNSSTGNFDWKAAAHAAFMVFSFMFLIPLGAILIRMEKWAKFHKFNQTFALALVLTGLAFGILTSFNYQRSRGFHSLHQVLGFIIVLLMLVQMAVGILHHLKWRKTKQPTLFGKIHLWNGRIVMTVGAVNGYMYVTSSFPCSVFIDDPLLTCYRSGFGFALDRKYALIVLGIVFFLVLCILGYIIWGAKRKMPRRQQGASGFEGLNHSYQQQQPQPWRNTGYSASVTAAPAYPSDPPPGYEPPSQQIGLQNVAPWRGATPDGRGSYEDEPLNLGASQKPREFT